MKKFIVEFTYTNGSQEEVSFETENIEWSIDQYYRNRAITSHTIIKEDNSSSKQMLFG